jgi:hypothetical protein
VRTRFVAVALAAVAAAATPAHAAPEVGTSGTNLGMTTVVTPDGHEYFVYFGVVRNTTLNGPTTRWLGIKIVETYKTCGPRPGCPGAYRLEVGLPLAEDQLDASDDLSSGTVRATVLGTRFVASWHRADDPRVTSFGGVRADPDSVALTETHNTAGTVSGWGVRCASPNGFSYSETGVYPQGRYVPKPRRGTSTKVPAPFANGIACA